MSRVHDRVIKRNGLVCRVGEQGSILSLCKDDSLERTKKLERGWQVLFRMRAIVVLGLGVAVLNTVVKKLPTSICCHDELSGE